MFSDCISINIFSLTPLGIPVVIFTDLDVITISNGLDLVNS